MQEKETDYPSDTNVVLVNGQVQDIQVHAIGLLTHESSARSATAVIDLGAKNIYEAEACERGLTGPCLSAIKETLRGGQRS